MYTGSITDQYEVWLQVVISMINGEKVSFEEEDLMYIAMLPFANSCGHFYQEMKDYLLKLVGDPMLPLLEISCEGHKPFEILFNEAIGDPENQDDYATEENAKVNLRYIEPLLLIYVSLGRKIACFHHGLWLRYFDLIIMFNVVICICY